MRLPTAARDRLAIVRSACTGRFHASLDVSAKHPRRGHLDGKCSCAGLVPSSRFDRERGTQDSREPVLVHTGSATGVTETPAWVGQQLLLKRAAFAQNRPRFPGFWPPIGRSERRESSSSTRFRRDCVFSRAIGGVSPCFRRKKRGARWPPLASPWYRALHDSALRVTRPPGLDEGRVQFGSVSHGGVLPDSFFEVRCQPSHTSHG